MTNISVIITSCVRTHPANSWREKLPEASGSVVSVYEWLFDLLHQCYHPRCLVICSHSQVPITTTALWTVDTCLFNRTFWCHCCISTHGIQQYPMNMTLSTFASSQRFCTHRYLSLYLQVLSNHLPLQQNIFKFLLRQFNAKEASKLCCQRGKSLQCFQWKIAFPNHFDER